MSKYSLIATYLDSLRVNQVTVSFSEFERIIETSLAPTARKHRAWWANSKSSGNTHPWANLWLDSGWIVSHVDMAGEEVSFSRSSADDVKRFWWVNQNQTYKYEVPGGFLWSPKFRADGARNQFYTNMSLTKPGELVFSFCDTHIKAVGLVTKSAKSAPKPEFGKSGDNWAEEGWLVEVEFKELVSQMRPKDHMEVLKQFLPEKYSPLQKNGDGLQSVYLAEISSDMARMLMELTGSDVESSLDSSLLSTNRSEADADAVEDAIKERTDIGTTIILQLVESRRGQGVFKSNLRLNETKCRVTGVSDIKHLRASHIKPWKDSDDQEKISGSNGLLLAPHVDHLFDRGFISFADDGQLLISKFLDEEVLGAWEIPLNKNVGGFTSKQKYFLKYHRLYIFKK